MSTKTIYSIDELSEYIKKKRPSIYLGSQTSTVLPFDQLIINKVDLSQMPKKIELDENNNLIIEGSVTWKEAKSFCESHNRQVMTTPTEELALCLSGIATSATGERSFGFGPIRDQIIEIEYINHNGERKVLSNKKLEIDGIDLTAYQNDFKKFETFKNAPFPRLEKEIDLMIGFEGQLGVITKAKFKTTIQVEEMYLFFPMERWESDRSSHLEFFDLVQGFRKTITACEFLDWNSMKYLESEDQFIQNQDLIFIEFPISKLEYIYDEFVSKLNRIEVEKIFEVSFQKCREFRMKIPRFVQERNQRQGIIKKGTDVQAIGDDFFNLLQTYQEWTKSGIDYNLFGHFGDGHLHFNFLPKIEETDQCQSILTQFYRDLTTQTVSPFAEHGIGIIKKNFIKNFYSKNQLEVFRKLKKEMDPERVFFPDGFLGN